MSAGITGATGIAGTAGIAGPAAVGAVVDWELVALPLAQCLLMGALAGLVGAIALVHRRIFFTESLTHATFPGAIIGVVSASWIAAALWGQRADFELLSAAVLLGAAAICVPMIALMRWLAGLPGLSSQSAAGIVLTLGFALGYFLSTWFAPLPLKIDSFLTGSILNTGRADIAALAAVSALCLAVIALGGRLLIFYSFDPVGYRASGLRPALAEAVILALICLTIVVLVPAVGTILPIALVAAPAATLAPWTRSARGLLIAAPLLGALTSAAGLWAGVALNLSVGGVIAALSALVHLAASGARMLPGTGGRLSPSPAPRADRT